VKNKGECGKLQKKSIRKYIWLGLKSALLIVLLDNGHDDSIAHLPSTQLPIPSLRIFPSRIWRWPNQIGLD